MTTENLDIVQENQPGLAMPMKTGTVGDNFSATFKYLKDIFIKNWKFMLVIALVMAAVATIGFTFLKNSSFWNILNGSNDLNNYESGDMAIFTKIMQLYNQFNMINMGLLLVLPVLIPFVYYFFYKFIKPSEILTDMPVRGFWKWFWSSIWSALVVGLLYVLAFIVVYAIFIGGIAALAAIGGGVVMAIGLIILIPLFIAALAFFMFFGIFSVLTMLPFVNLFKNIGPFKALKYSIKAIFSQAGSRKGGMWGLNCWHLIGLMFLMQLIVISIGSIFSLITIPGYMLTMDSSATVQFVVMFGIFFIKIFYYLLAYVLPLVSQSIYFSEQLTFSNYPLREELINNGR